MSLTLHRSEEFNVDFDVQYRWYLREAGETVAEGYMSAVLATVQALSQAPGVGRLRRFRHQALRDLRSLRVSRPFDRHVLFYRYTESDLFIERVMHGMRDLPRRLLEPPEAP